MHIAPITLASILLLGGLLYCEQDGKPPLVFVKSTLSLLFITAALVQPHTNPRYFSIVLSGLTACLIGDVCLALPGSRSFFYGLVAFLIGHLFYVGAFFFIAEFNSFSWVGIVSTAIVSGSVYLVLKPHLGRMRLPVLYYVVVISFMMVGAITAAGSGRLPPAARWGIFSGAAFFYLSDVFVARDRFVRKSFINRLIGLPLYYAGQFLLAFSVGWV